jgi:hypothetical protein
VVDPLLFAVGYLWAPEARLLDLPVSGLARRTHADSPWVGIGRFSLYGIPELSSIGLIIESEPCLWPTGVPYYRRCVVAAGLLPPHKTIEKILHFLQLVAGGRSFSLSNNTHDEMGLGLAVLELMPRHSGHIDACLE